MVRKIAYRFSRWLTHELPARRRSKRSFSATVAIVENLEDRKMLSGVSAAGLGVMMGALHVPHASMPIERNPVSAATIKAGPSAALSAPVVTVNPSGASVRAGLYVTLTAAASGNPTPTVQWQVSSDGGKTFKNVVGATSTTFRFKAYGVEYYRAVFTNSQGTAVTTTARVVGRVLGW